MSKPRQSGAWIQRWLIRLFTVLFGVFAFWLIGFLLDDISHWPGPDFQALQKQMLPAELDETATRLKDQKEGVKRDIAAQQARQTILQASTETAQTTMNQLLQFQKLSLEKGVKPTEQEQLALAESQQRFLDNQTQSQQLTSQIAQLQEQQRNLEAQERANEQKLEEARAPIYKEYGKLSRRHDLWLAAVKLAVLTPLLIVSVLLFLRNRESIYVPLFAAFGVAVAIQAMLVMHEYFPARSFKYVLIVTSLAISTKALLSLIRAAAYPKPEWLLKQYREAYEAFLCPICEYPIRRGPLKFAYWTRRTIKRLTTPIASAGADEPYACPACSTQLFEKCPACGGTRHSLLPTCEHCGAIKVSGGEAS
jgi:hypothetical protein